MKKILFLGSKPIGYFCLEHLFKNQNEHQAEVVGVLSNENSRFSKELSIRKLTQEFQVPFFENLDDILDLSGVDFIISVQYHLILKEHHIKIAGDLAINLHMAPLPEYRGCNQFSFALYNGESEFGTTLHRLETGIDNGALISERRFAIEDEDDVQSLYQKTVDQSLTLFNESIGDILLGNYQLTPQKDLLAQRATNIYYRKDIEGLKQINLDDSSDEIVRRVRASSMQGFEPAFATIEGKKYYIIPEEHWKK